MALDRTISHINEAIQSGKPWLFGAALHQLQDYFSHWQEGYHDLTWGHAYDSSIKLLRDDRLLSNFYNGGHYEMTEYQMTWISSPYPAHPEEEVKQELQQRNPGLDLYTIMSEDGSRLSGEALQWAWVDLYLRTRKRDSATSDLAGKRKYFGFNTDYYIPGSQRDFLMERYMDIYIHAFLTKWFSRQISRI